jgi:hypothetical protein
MTRFALSPNSRPWIALALGLVLGAFAPVHADEAPAAPKVEPAEAPAAAPVGPLSAEAPDAPAATEAPVLPRRQPSPMMVAIRAVLDAEAATVNGLRERIRAARTPDEAIALQRELERAKFEAEVSILRVQAKFAREGGRTALAEHLDAAIAQLTNPTKPVAPAARPIPARETTAR